MKKIHLKSRIRIPFTIFVICIATAIVFFLPPITFSFDISLVLTVISLLFAILIGFFFASAMSNFLRFQTLITDEDATIMTIYNYVALIDSVGAKKVANAIDAYVISSFDYESLSYAANVHKELRSVISAVDDIKTNDPAGIAMLQNLQSAKMHLYPLNQEIALTAKCIVSPQHWAVIHLLAGLVGVLLLSLRDGTTVTALFISILSVTIYLILRLLQEVDSNQLLERQLSFESSQTIFETMGKLRYYPQTALSVIRLPKDVKKYRVGIYKDLSKSFEKDIRIVTVK